MAVKKKRIFTISLLLILLADGTLCGYSISKYKGSAAPSQIVNEPRGSLPSERNRPSGLPGQTPGERSQVSDNADQTPGGQAADPAQRQRNRQPDLDNQPDGQFPGQDAAQPAPSGRRGFGGIASAGNKYAPQLLCYAAVFLIVFIAACCFYPPDSARPSI